MISVLKTGSQAAKRHPVYLAGLIAIAVISVAVLYRQQPQPMGSDAAGRAGGGYEKAWAVVAASSDAGKFVAANYRTCVETRDTDPATADGWLTIVHSPLETAAQCGLKTVSLASAKGDVFVAQVKNVISSLPTQIAVPG
jgi:hypothetical protein